MDAVRALHHEIDSKASLVGINDDVYRRFYDGLKDVELVTVSAKRIIDAKALKLSMDDEDFLDVLVKEAQAEKLATQRMMKENSKNLWEKRDLRTVQELPGEKLEAGTPPVSIENANIHVSDCQQDGGNDGGNRNSQRNWHNRAVLPLPPIGSPQTDVPQQGDTTIRRGTESAVGLCTGEKARWSSEECWNPASGYLRGRGTGSCPGSGQKDT